MGNHSLRTVSSLFHTHTAAISSGFSCEHTDKPSLAPRSVLRRRPCGWTAGHGACPAGPGAISGVWWELCGTAERLEGFLEGVAPTLPCPLSPMDLSFPQGCCTLLASHHPCPAPELSLLTPSPVWWGTQTAVGTGSMSTCPGYLEWSLCLSTRPILPL